LSSLDVTTFLDFLARDHLSLDEAGNVKKSESTTGAGASFLQAITFSTLSSDSRFALESRVFEPLHVQLVEILCNNLPTLVHDLTKFLLSRTWESEVQHYSTTVSEVFSAVIRIKSQANHQSKEEATELVKLLLDVTDKCSLQTLDDWLTGLRLAVTQTDPRKLKWFIDELLQEGVSSPEFRLSSPLILYRRLRLIQPLLIEFSWRAGSFVKKVVDLFIECKDLLFESPYQQVRQEVGRVLMLVFENSFRIGSDYSTLPISPVIMEDLFTKTIAAPVSAMDYEAKSESTLLESSLYFLNLALQFSDIETFGDCLPPLLWTLIRCAKHVNVEIAAVSKNCVEMIAASKTPSRLIPSFLTELNKIQSMPSWSAKLEALRFIAAWARGNSVSIPKADFQLLTTLTLDCLKDDRLEVRECAVMTLSQLLTCAGSKVNIEKLQKRLFRAARTKGKTKENLADKSFGILGLCGMIYSEPWDIPEWMPVTLAFLADFAHDSTPASISAKKVLSEFKKLRQDTWHIVEAKLTAEQLSALRGVDTAPSYFA
jgi:hypothetical protein